MIFTETPLEGSYSIQLEPRDDERGFFSRLFCAREFEEYNLNTRWVHINNSLSKSTGTLRGLHLQNKPYTEVKLIRCIKGSIWDVIVDIRKQSKTFGKWYGMELDSEKRNMMYVPKGFAHGFVSLKEKSEIIYLNSEFYEPNSELTLSWNDVEVNINWPIDPIYISDKDKKGISLREVSEFYI